MSEKLKLEKLILGTNGGKKKIELTLEEAKELHAQLDALFGKKVEFVPGGYTPPIIIERNHWPWVYPYPYHNTPTWCGDTATVSSDNIQVTYCCSSV